MCRGGTQSGINAPAAPANVAKTGSVSCELCNSTASLYCEADDAFLCRKCDRWVHGANFLAQRHVRCLICGFCQRLTQQYLIGTSVLVMVPGGTSGAAGRSHCDSSDERRCSKTLETPFLFL